MLSRLSLSGLLAAAVLTPLSVAAAPAAIADDCPRAELVFARGTAEAPGLGLVGDALAAALTNKVSGMGTYAVNYPASYNFLNTQNGANDAAAHIAWMADNCPNTKIVLGGYSQGASVVNIVAGFNGVNWGDPLPRQYMDSVVAVATFGNVANRTGGPTNTQSSPLASKSIDLCNPADPICHEGSGNSWSGHTDGYVPVYTDKAAAYIASALLTHSTPQYGLQLPSVPADNSPTESGQSPGLQLPSVPADGSPTGSGQAPGPQQPATVAAVPSQPGSTAPGLVVTGT